MMITVYLIFTLLTLVTVDPGPHDEDEMKGENNLQCSAKSITGEEIPNNFIFEETQHNNPKCEEGIQFRDALTGQTYCVAKEGVDEGKIWMVKNCEKYDGPSTKTTFIVLDENKDKFSTLKTALDAAGITQETINGLKPTTIFAPTNDAFNKLPSGLLDELLKPENKENLTNILNNHIIKNQKIEISGGMLTFGI